jgi:gamma-glutamyl:cysteine ligase YbdK (ATP-grasp superfamily)
MPSQRKRSRSRRRSRSESDAEKKIWESMEQEQYLQKQKLTHNQHEKMEKIAENDDLWRALACDLAKSSN